MLPQHIIAKQPLSLVFTRLKAHGRVVRRKGFVVAVGLVAVVVGHLLAMPGEVNQNGIARLCLCAERLQGLFNAYECGCRIAQGLDVFFGKTL